MRTELADRYWQTIRLMAPAQVAHRVRLRSQRAAYQRFPDRLLGRWASDIAEAGSWPTEFQPIDRSVAHPPIATAENGDPIYELLGERLDLVADGWRPAERTQLFRYHLHYFEWAWPMTRLGEQERFAELWTGWHTDTLPGRWDEWSPYVVALRSWVLCGVFDDLVRGTPIEAEIVHHQRAALGFFDHNLELDVGGNHLIKNLKAVIGLAVFFDDRRRLDAALDRFGKQLEHQILSDGGHFELSPGYHAQVMADLIDVVGLCEAADIPMPFDGGSIIGSMSGWLQAMTYPDGTVPPLGDCTPPLDGLMQALEKTTPSTDPATLTVLAETGYVCVRQESSMLVVDFGAPCPPELPAHAQADWGTFELWHNGARMICDPGVSTYVGPRRATERSTATHNTVSIMGRNQTDVWSSFRAGKRATPGPIQTTMDGFATSFGCSLVDIHGVHHHRRFEVTANEVRVTDTIEPHDEGALSTLTLAAGVDATAILASHVAALHDTTIAAGFGQLIGAQRLQQPLIDGEASWTIPLHGPAGGKR